MNYNYTFRLSEASIDNWKKEAFKHIGYNPLALPDNEFNNRRSFYLRVRGLYRLMLFVHNFILFPRHNDPDLGQYIINEDNEEVLPITYEVNTIVKNRYGNCGTFAFFFEFLCYIIGFPVRHIGIYHQDKKQGHQVSEILIENKWIFFDPMYLVCPMDKDNNFYSAWELIENCQPYIDDIPSILQCVKKEFFPELFSHLIINNIKSWDIGEEKFIETFYGKQK